MLLFLDDSRPEWRSRYRDSLPDGWYGNRSSVRVTFSAPVQTSPGTHSASCVMGSGSSPTPVALGPGKWPGTHRTWGWVGPRVDLYGCVKSRPRRDSTPRQSSPYQFAILAHNTANTWIHSQGSPSWIFGGKTGNGIGIPECFSCSPTWTTGALHSIVPKQKGKIVRQATCR